MPARNTFLQYTDDIVFLTNYNADAACLYIQISLDKIHEYEKQRLGVVSHKITMDSIYKEKE